MPSWKPKSRNWLKLRKKTDEEAPYEPPMWLGDFSNGELYHEQTAKERRIRDLILRLGDERARYYGIERREFMASGLGVALTMAVVNLANGCSGGSDGGYAIPNAGSGGGGAGGAPPGGVGGAAGTLGGVGGMQAVGGSSGAAGASVGGSSGASASGGTGGIVAGTGGVGGMPDPVECETALDYSDKFIFDIQTHRVETVPGVYRLFLGALPQGGCGMGVPGCYSKDEYVRVFFLESDTTTTVLSGIPATDGNNPLTNDQIAESRDYVNALASETQRVVSHVMVLPNYNHEAQLEGMASAITAQAPVGAWKCYTPWGPGDGVTGFWLDDPMTGIPFIEQGRTLGIKTFACHKGLPLPGFDNTYGDPKDLGVVAARYPDCKFIAYHSAYQFGDSDEMGGYTMGSRDGVNSLVTACLDNDIPVGGNVYGELGTTWNSIKDNPTQATHVLGKLLKYLGEDNIVWGTDCMWYGSPQPQIMAFMAFQMNQTIREAEGYPDLTPEIKTKILGLNAAAVYGIDPGAQRCGIAGSEIATIKRDLDGEFGRYRWALQKPLLRTRREFFQHLSFHRTVKLPG